MERQSGAWIEDPETGELTPDMNDEAMRERFKLLDTNTTVPLRRDEEVTNV